MSAGVAGEAGEFKPTEIDTLIIGGGVGGLEESFLTGLFAANRSIAEAA